ncbi:J domain-containing protein [Kribbella solani]|uniref:J domain-containing protein n=1 Tax=Kribbella solani TaxID=236067 RepID=UPI0029A3E136|nr:J domain-containing protein [Kribbella solani]MDX3005736.1 J domain-containing protein [Kribbella solani]
MSGPDHYEVLNVERTATTAEIKTAYRKLVRQVHPDQGGSAALFRVVQEAWTTLSDPTKRAAYDHHLTSQTGTTTTACGEAGARGGPGSAGGPGARGGAGAGGGATGAGGGGAHGGASRPSADGGASGPGAGGAGAGAGESFGGGWGAAGAGGEWGGAGAGGEWGGGEWAPGVGAVEVWPGFGRGRGAALGALGVYAVGVVLVFLGSNLGGGWSIAIAVGLASTVVLAAPPHWSRRIPLHRLFKAYGVVVALGGAWTLFSTNNTLSTLDRTVLAALLAGLLGAGFLTRRWSKVHALDTTIDPPAAYDFNLWGRPGEPLIDDGRAARLAPDDVLRHRRTATVLDAVVSMLPAAKLVHGARIGDLAVSHLLLNGHRMALVASLIGPPGSYTLDAYGSLVCNGRPVAGPQLDTALTAWRTRHPSLAVRGFLILHPVVDGQSGITAQSAPDAAVTLLPAQSAAGELLVWLQAEGNVLDRRVLYDILHRAPYGLGAR